MASDKMRSVEKPPVAEKQEKILVAHQHTRNDPYYWFNDRNNHKVLHYLEAENKYTDHVMAHTKALQKKLFKELKERICETDMSVPIKKGPYFYYVRYEKNKEYPIYARKKDSLEHQEEILLDINKLAKNEDFCDVVSVEVSPNHQWLAYSIDYQGRRFANVSVKNLLTNKVDNNILTQVTGNFVWANDNQTLFYTRQDPETLRSYQIYKHTLNAHQADVLMYEENDDSFSIELYKTRSDEMIFAYLEHLDSSEYLFLSADQPDGIFEIFAPRQKGIIYTLDYLQGNFYIRTNQDALNFKLMKTSIKNKTSSFWQEVVPHRANVLLEGFEIYQDYIVTEERCHGLDQIQIISPKGCFEPYYLTFNEPAYSASIEYYPDTSSHILRYRYESMTTPETIYDFDMQKKKRELKKQKKVQGDYNPENYKTERVFAMARDGKTEIPISLVYRQNLKDDQKGNPLLLLGYGAYGMSEEVNFSISRLILLDRGFVVAMAHVRGGEELGREWYQQGKLFNKKNSFEDFIQCAQCLLEKKYAKPDLLFAMGGSAGGLLVGTVANLRPDLFKGIIAEVPFVDVVTTMLDPSLPLTTMEYDEWGDPNDEKAYYYMLSYSPYDNVEEKVYPNMLVTTGLHDPQVQFWEPAKWVAKLRDKNQGNSLVLLKIDLLSGHGGPSGRYKQYEYIAFLYAFLLDQV